MQKLLYTLVLALAWCNIQSQTLYFPPTSGSTWDTIAPSALNWCPYAIPPFYQYLESRNTKAFIVLKDGKIVLEKYFGTFTADSNWYWASASKTLVAFAVGLAQEKNKLNINNPTSDYLGKEWTSCPPDKEALITVRHQLTMTSGLDETVKNPDCTDKECLQYKAPAGSRWYYHNAPYTLLDAVVEKATGIDFNTFIATNISRPIGMNGIFIKRGYNNIYYSTARSMARFGLMVLNKGKWENNAIMKDSIYYNQMVSRSQELNKSYGYLWWLNGQSSYRTPGLTIELQGPLTPNAPADMFAALGKNGQMAFVVPSENIVMIRLGNPPDTLGGLVSLSFSDEIWKEFNKIRCKINSVAPTASTAETTPVIYPNPATGQVFLKNIPPHLNKIEWMTTEGKIYQLPVENGAVEVSSFPAGMYYIKAGSQTTKIIVE